MVLCDLAFRSSEHFLDGFREAPFHPHLLHSTTSADEFKLLKLEAFSADYIRYES